MSLGLVFLGTPCLALRGNQKEDRTPCSGFRLSSHLGQGLAKGHMLNNLEAKAASHLFSPGFSAICHLWPMLGSERENSDSIAFTHKWSNTQCFLHTCSPESANCSQYTVELLNGKLIPPNEAMHVVKLRVKLS